MEFQKSVFKELEEDIISLNSEFLVTCSLPLMKNAAHVAGLMCIMFSFCIRFKRSGNELLITNGGVQSL